MNENTSIAISISIFILAVCFSCMKSCEYENITARQRIVKDTTIQSAAIAAGYVDCIDKDGKRGYYPKDRCRSN